MPGKVCLNNYYNRVQKRMMLLWKLEMRIRKKKIINNQRSSGFRSNHWSFIATVLFSYGPKLQDHTHQVTSKIKLDMKLVCKKNHISPSFELSSMNDTNQRGHGVHLKWYVTFGHWTKMLIFQATIEDQHVQYKLGSGSNNYLIWPGGKTDSEDTEWESSRVISFYF